jgi:subtilisin family serine protease
VAGTIAARGGNGIGVVGVLPNAKMPLHIAKVFDASGSTSSSTVAKAMLACRKAGANVVSMSLGGSSPSKLQQFVAKFLAGKGVLLVAASGNAGTTAISYPAGFPEVMSVGALDANKAWASFSQFNADVEISAAGVGVESTVPVGSASETTTVVGNSSYSSIPLTGTPLTVVTAPLYNFGLGTAQDPGAAGKVCLIQRGSISFSDKVLACQASGGVGAVIYNNTAGPLNGTLNGVVTTIPSTGVSDVDGAAMLGQIGQSATVDTVNLIPVDYAAFNGTSMSTPHVAGIAALVWSQHLSCTAEQIRSSLKNSAMDLGDVGRDDKFGAGLIQAKAAGDRITALGCGN